MIYGMKTGNEIKQEILVKLGIQKKFLRVTVDTSYRVTLMDYSVDIEAVKKYMKDNYEKIGRCEATGEILSGGNTFCMVDYSSKCEIHEYHREILKNLIRTTCLEGCDSYDALQRLKIRAEEILHRDIVSRLTREDPEIINLVEWAITT